MSISFALFVGCKPSGGGAPPDNNAPGNAPADNNAPVGGGGAEGVTVIINLTSSWVGGFGADIVVTNHDATPIDGWTLTFDFVPVVTSAWNGTMTGNAGNWTVTPADWNSTIAGNGGSATVGLNADGTLTAGSATNGVLNGNPVEITVNLAGGGGGGGGAGSPVVLPDVDGVEEALQLTVALGGAGTDFTVDVQGVESPVLELATNNPSVVSWQINGSVITLTGLEPGRAGLRIRETGSDSVRYIGVRVRNADGSIPGMPAFVSIGSVSEDSTTDLDFWRAFGDPATNKRVDIRYIYLNGGPFLGWTTWGADGGRARGYIRESKKLGMIPFFVYYNIPDGGESYTTNLEHMQSSDYMEAYYQDLQFALDIASEESPDEIVGFIFEPDAIGYMAQLHPDPPDETFVSVSSAYDSGVLTRGVDPDFPDTLRGMIESINYIAQRAPNVYFGWQMNLWAAPAGGFTGIAPPGTGIVHHTDTAATPAQFESRRVEIYSEAAAITRYYIDAGILTHGADFVSIDKYGLDAGAQNGAAEDPASSIWFWNHDHWLNYLEFVRAMHDTTNVPIVLWQITCGRINSTETVSPYHGNGTFPDLDNTHTRYEDSGPSFFLGDDFTTTGVRFDHFSANRSSDPDVGVVGNRITWGENVTAARDVGVISILFGAGVGASTDGVGSPPTDDYWWITKVQDYYPNRVPLQNE